MSSGERLGSVEDILFQGDWDSLCLSSVKRAIRIRYIRQIRYFVISFHSVK